MNQRLKVQNFAEERHKGVKNCHPSLKQSELETYKAGKMSIKSEVPAI